MLYRIIITQNGKRKKILHKSNDLKFIKRKYFNVKDKNKVLFSKKTNSYLKTKPVKYELILIKKWESGDIPFIDRDDLGRVVEINDTDNKWTILYKNEYFYEETFTIFDHNKKLTAIDIIKNIVMEKHKTIMIKQVNYIHNKLLIHQDNDFNIILCKCPADSKRLYDILENFCENNKINNILFTGSVGNLNKTDVYKMIIEKTGWSKNKIYRTTTRP